MEHPITPPDELVQQWRHQWVCLPDQDCGPDLQHYIATQAAQWGADQELESCCAEVPWYTADKLRAARRPKPPSLKEQALDRLQQIEANIPQSLNNFEFSCETIRRALEQLNE